MGEMSTDLSQFEMPDPFNRRKEGGSSPQPMELDEPSQNDMGAIKADSDSTTMGGWVGLGGWVVVVGGGPIASFDRYSLPGMAEDAMGSSDIEGVAPSLVRRPGAKPTCIPVEMQMGYEAGGRRMGALGLVAEGSGELRSGVDDKDAKMATRITQFLVFELAGCGCSEVERGAVSFERN